jgi:hypothetical protein
MYTWLPSLCKQGFTGHVLRAKKAVINSLHRVCVLCIWLVYVHRVAQAICAGLPHNNTGADLRN